MDFFQQGIDEKLKFDSIYLYRQLTLLLTKYCKYYQ